VVGRNGCYDERLQGPIASVLLVSLFPAPLAGTTVAIVRTPDLIVIAADSMAGDGVQKLTVCKIGTSQSSPISFAVAGPVRYSRTGFDAVALAQAAVSRAESIQEAATEFGRLAMKPFQTAATSIRTELPQQYDYIRKSPEPLQVVFAAIENGVPRYVIAYFTLAETPAAVSALAHQRACPGDGCSGARSLTVLGFNDAAKREASDPGFLAGLDPVSAARKLVELEIEDSPDSVGPPVSVLTIDRTGSSWTSRGSCR
jgi:hypothetical protein